MTAQTWIDQTRDMLATDYVEEYVTLGGALTASGNDNTVSFALPSATPAGVVAGATFEFGTELFYVMSVTDAGLATVLRGFRGSTVATHVAGDVGIVNPKFPAYQILDQLNNELDSLTSAENGLFQVKTVDLTFSAAQQGYDLAGVTDTVLDLAQVTYNESSSANSEPEIRTWDIRRNRDTDDFASGVALILYGDAEQGRTVRVQYKTEFANLTGASSTLASTGVPSTAYDVVPLGAALRMMATRPIRREFLDEQGFSAQRSEVPAGAVTDSMRPLIALHTQRVSEEATRLDQLYPKRWNRGGVGMVSTGRL